LPGALEEEIAAFVEHYNHRRAHESLDNLTPADVYHGRARKIQTLRNALKEQTPASQTKGKPGNAALGKRA